MRSQTAEPLSEDDMRAFCRKVGRERSFDCSQFRPNYLRRRLTTRLRATGCVDLGEYMSVLDRSPGEWDALLNALTVNVTQFFRDGSAWSLLRHQVLPELLEQKERRRQSFIRVWSAGCSSGQEAYSLAILFREVMGDGAAAERVRITATDYDRACLLRAKRGVYARDQLVGLSPRQLSGYLEKVDGGYRMRDDLRHMVRFSHLDLFQPDSQRLMDMILCRNVVMYFNPVQQSAVLRKFAAALVPRGFLVLGKSEKLPTYMAEQFDYYNMAERVYRRKVLEEAR